MGRRGEGFAEGRMWVRRWGFFWVFDLGIHGGGGGF